MENIEKLIKKYNKSILLLANNTGLLDKNNIMKKLKENYIELYNALKKQCHSTYYFDECKKSLNYVGTNTNGKNSLCLVNRGQLIEIIKADEKQKKKI